MTKEELKNKYSAFITEISEILGLGKPIDILKLCATTDLFFQPLEKHIEELEKENEKLMQMLASSADCETCKHYDEDLEKEDKEPCKNCFYDNSFWELKED